MGAMWKRPAGPGSRREVSTVAEKKISPKAPTGTAAKKSGVKAATRVQKIQKKQKKQRRQGK
jgi:hypothetical protein